MTFDHIEAFYRPRTLSEAIRLLRSTGSRGRVVAGATDLAVQSSRTTRFLVDITRLGLDYIRPKGGGLVIGATTTMSALEESPRICSLADGILAKAASTCGSVQIRNMATIGGNLANASPAADTATPLLALDAVAVVAGPRGRRRIPLAEFFTGHGKTVLHGALLVEVEIPLPPRGGRVGWSFQKLGRIESDISVVNVAAGIQFDSAGRCTWVRIALGAVGPTPLRARKAEAALLGQAASDDLLHKVSEQAMREARPISDIRASAEYRREMSGVMVKRALQQCITRAGLTS